MSHANAMKAKIAMGRKQLGLDEDTYRAMLEAVTGHSSTKDCSDGQLSRVIDHLASKGAVFVSAKGSKQGSREYKAKAAQRRSDFYEIPDGPLAAQKRKICAMWKDLGYDMLSLDIRTKRQCKVDLFVWCDDQAYLQKLGRDLENRLTRKREKAAKAEA